MIGWTRSWHGETRHELRYIRVKKYFNQETNVVTTVGNSYTRDIWFRRPIGEIAEGLYDVGINGGLTPINHRFNEIYPDLDIILPNFGAIRKYACLPRAARSRIMEFIQGLYKEEYRGVILTSGAVCSCNIRDEPSKYRLDVPELVELDHYIPLSINMLQLALTEMNNYDDDVFLLRENYEKSPVVIGCSPYACVIMNV